ncbi:ABC transporter ATP-binding protein [Celeribacter halophilus]|uniref:Quaternary amine transport ATP-binding protein n=1 Tax=Celeribacter halophilus TaxID=576117 RepID=A0A1I3WF86_9RHOB|nr:ABC transporter ATP-binding protein [Celeribacter halophilus]MBU2888163.1 ABC transporter ATP-binding protein [Celeribacter halophilus]MDO6512130.1 ABC transporter ATP-binding protein [Celeribacter halophilus]PZX06797.1 osmoprotectant transport system ATP-binding protein [Celeribacter halophilus]SFK06112.1 osmoprotectant transport system ATP-binding protein [Celeribacter halophilus]
MIKLEKLSKIFETPNGGTVMAADKVSLEVAKGEICVLLGPSGCGKTTTLKMINGLIPKTSGKIHVAGRDTDTIDPVELRRSIGYVIQQIGLFPNMTIEDNICIVPDLLGWERSKARKRAAELLDLVNLDPSIFLKRFPKELSGGQQQRVGVIRALAADPPVLLMDEPFGAIDPINRAVIQDEFLRMQTELRKTIAFVSHDIDEAIKMADKIAIFRDGKLEQFDSPDDLLARPANDFIASFLGSDRTLKRLSLLKVSDVMLSGRIRVSAQDDVATARDMMKEAGHKNIVMVGPRGRARGYLHLNDVVEASGTVEEHYQALPTTVNVDADLRTAVSRMFRHDMTWMACVDDDGFFKGFITQRAISHQLGATYRDTPTEGLT